MKLLRPISAALGRFTETGHHGHWEPEVVRSGPASLRGLGIVNSSLALL